MKDLDLTRYIVLSKESRVKILNQLESDSIFLKSIGVMDYSLLLGIYYMQIAHNAPRDLRGFLDKGQTMEDEENTSNTKEAEHLLNDFHGGVRAQVSSLQYFVISCFVVEGPGIYYIGIIDILQSWTIRKKLEHYFKRWVLRKPAAGISCVDPRFYQRRFMTYMRRIMITDETFLKINSINTDMFRQSSVLQYPPPEVVDDTFRIGRMSSLMNEDDINRTRSDVQSKAIKTESILDIEDPVPISMKKPSDFLNKTHQQTSFRHTYRLHRGNSSTNVSNNRTQLSDMPVIEENKELSHKNTKALTKQESNLAHIIDLPSIELAISEETRPIMSQRDEKSTGNTQ
ncbi:phosphatidylinositol-4-phosphate 5-kinase [Reticulomyxa filosa]|uniref:Phosphatidylinositol-4-phosphate 5-kinase n=1 Tax=Reticulomyxa filosa TaxID=46433 RepID=X6P237_RETFI|nr:phosphatidylinositol-4-phosphate 5-kinase [Reticulomyxa filosa]|eukprot:ETO31622.1 phosphatidylinositol-4-phosphate 5-kinase [Reticulomyxa filosa]